LHFHDCLRPVFKRLTTRAIPNLPLLNSAAAIRRLQVCDSFPAA